METRYCDGLEEIDSREQYNRHLHEVINSNSKVGHYYHLLMEDDSKIESVIQDEMLSPKEFIEVIALCRKVIYNSATGGSNKAAENETDRLYARNPWKFVEEFLQNADDCSYNQTPSIRIVIDECVEHRPAIEFIYNEEGFQRSDVWAITAFSESTKVGGTVKPQEENGVFYREKTGRKGRGFKSVFSLKAENVIVHIRSNGFSFKLDRCIGRILPVWEDDKKRMDGLTHVIVELVNPEFEVKEVYPEFRRLFCVDDCESIFEKSPFLFMHRLRHVCVERLLPNGGNLFSTEYEEDTGRTEYLDAVILNPEKKILAGIKYKGTFYRKQYQTGRIVTNDDGRHGSYSIIRYTEMMEDEDSYRNYSIIAPLIFKDTEVHWSSGALFRTFPMSQHHLDIPLAIDAPFILNLDRSGILYNNYREEENQDIPANIWNSKVSEQLFKREGVLESFYLWARTVPEICIDRYIPSTPIVLFDDRNNNDDHDGRWIPTVNVSDLCQNIPVFRLSFNSNQYTDYKNAWLVDHSLFACIK